MPPFIAFGDQLHLACMLFCCPLKRVWLAVWEYSRFGNGIKQQQNSLNLHVTQAQEDYNASLVQVTQTRITQSTRWCKADWGPKDLSWLGPQRPVLIGAPRTGPDWGSKDRSCFALRPLPREADGAEAISGLPVLCHRAVPSSKLCQV